MDQIDRINFDVAKILGWEMYDKEFRRWDEKHHSWETSAQIPAYTENWNHTWYLVDYASAKRIEFSLFMMHYDIHPIFMASFIKGMTQRTSTGDDPKVAICKAFTMMFYPENPAPHLTKTAL